MNQIFLGPGGRRVSVLNALSKLEGRAWLRPRCWRDCPSAIDLADQKPTRARIRQLPHLDRMLENGFITVLEPEQTRTERAAPVAPAGLAQVRVHAEFAANGAPTIVAQYGDEAYTWPAGDHQPCV
jgi:hypothetical protein